jgi:hypothetical protein
MKNLMKCPICNRVPTAYSVVPVSKGLTVMDEVTCGECLNVTGVVAVAIRLGGGSSWNNAVHQYHSSNPNPIGGAMRDIAFVDEMADVLESNSDEFLKAVAKRHVINLIHALAILAIAGIVIVTICLFSVTSKENKSLALIISMLTILAIIGMSRQITKL